MYRHVMDDDSGRKSEQWSVCFASLVALTLSCMHFSPASAERPPSTADNHGWTHQRPFFELYINSIQVEHVRELCFWGQDGRLKRLSLL